MQVIVPKDLGATWKLLMRRGACKVATFPCHCFSVKSSELAQFKVEYERCEKFKLDGNERCTCWLVLDNEHMQQLNMHSQYFTKERNVEDISFEEFTEKDKTIKIFLRH